MQFRLFSLFSEELFKFIAGAFIETSVRSAIIALYVSDLHELNCLLYASVILAIELSNLENQCYVKEKKKINNRKDNWKQSFQRKVNSLRADISKITQINNQNPSIKIRKNNAEMKRKHKIYSERKRLEVLEKLKQQLMAKNNRLQRFIKREKQFQQNNAFVNKPKIFYRELRGTKIDIDQAPNIETIDNFWRPIFENEKSYNKDSTWIKEYEDSINIEQQQHTDVTEAEIQASINKFANWKSPGIDKIQNFWWKHFTKIHHRFSQLTSNVILNPENTPSWLTTGRTTLIPKSIKCDNPSKFRPITCLPIMYKIISSVINIRLLQHLSSNNLKHDEQKGCSPNTYGCIDQLLIDAMILDDAKNRQKNLSVAWIDYRKAYDSIPHDWLIKSLEIHKFDQTIIAFIKYTMSIWATTLNINMANETITTNKININAGIF